MPLRQSTGNQNHAKTCTYIHKLFIALFSIFNPLCTYVLLSEYEKWDSEAILTHEFDSWFIAQSWSLVESFQKIAL